MSTGDTAEKLGYEKPRRRDEKPTEKIVTDQLATKPVDAGRQLKDRIKEARANLEYAQSVYKSRKKHYEEAIEHLEQRRAAYAALVEVAQGVLRG